jgi:hypothetical protein
VDISLQSGNFIWSNNWDSPSWCKIDRFLISPEWEDHFLNVVHSRLTRVLLDHFLILLDSGHF